MECPGAGVKTFKGKAPFTDSARTVLADKQGRDFARQLMRGKGDVRESVITTTKGKFILSTEKPRKIG
jgi:hypothetical protein